MAATIPQRGLCDRHWEVSGIALRRRIEAAHVAGRQAEKDAAVRESALRLTAHYKRLERLTVYRTRRTDLPPAGAVLQNGMWEGKPGFLVLGGPSPDASGFDWALLRGLNTVGVNMAFQRGTAVNYVGDTRLIEMLEADPDAGWNEYEGIKLINRGIKPHFDDRRILLDRCYWLVVNRRGPNAWGGTIEEGLVTSNNAGLTGLNLIDALGCDPIYLIGADMYGDGSRAAHSHGYYKGTKRETDSRVYRDFVRQWAANVPERVRKKTVNASPDSSLDLFEKITIRELEEAIRGIS